MAANKPVPITQAGLARLQQELDDLTGNQRRDIAERIHEIRELSATDQSDGEFDEAKNAQAFIEGRILTIQSMLSDYEIIDESDARKKDKVHIGATVTVTVGRREQRFTIVGIAEMDPAQGLVSDESPVGRALLGHKIGEAVEVDAPSGPIKMRIKAID